MHPRNFVGNALEPGPAVFDSAQKEHLELVTPPFPLVRRRIPNPGDKAWPERKLEALDTASPERVAPSSSDSAFACRRDCTLMQVRSAPRHHDFDAVERNPPLGPQVVPSKLLLSASQRSTCRLLPVASAMLVSAAP